MAKLFADRLQILEAKLENIHDNTSLEERLTTVANQHADLEQRVCSCEKKIESIESKINQIINEITPIITSHANALNALLGSAGGNSSR